MNKESLSLIIKKREFSQLPLRDIENAYAKFEKRQVSEEEKVRLTRELLHKIYGAFASKKILSLKNKDEEWVLRKHLSTRERLPYYKEVYSRILKDFNGEIFDLGAGINGLSYKYFGKKLKYIAVEGVGQLVEFMNHYFQKEKIKGQAIHTSLFKIEEVKKIIKKEKGEKIVFLFKVLDSLEELDRDYSKKLINELASLVDKIVVSFATRSMVSKRKFKVDRSWIISFIGDNFNILDDFEVGGERYVVFSK